MRIEGLTVRLRTPDITTGEDGPLSVALLVMDDVNDVGRTTGYYWDRPVDPEDDRDLAVWTAAVAEGRGPFDSVHDATLGAGNAVPETIDAAFRLEQASGVVRTGHIEPDPETILAYLQRTAEMDAQRRSQPDGDGRTAVGLYIEDGKAATAAMLAEAEANDKSAADMMREALAEEERLAAAGGAVPEADDADDPDDGESEETMRELLDRELAQLDEDDMEHVEVMRRQAVAEYDAEHGDDAVEGVGFASASGPPRAPAAEAVPDELAQAVAALSVQLARVGSNLNQATKSLNAGALRKLLRRRGDDEIAGALRETRAVLEQILPVLAIVEGRCAPSASRDAGSR